MLDDNLPTFFLKPSPGAKHNRELFLSYHGSEPAPSYSLRHIDPESTSPQHRNCYAAALFDCHNPDILYGEVVARPSFSQPTLSQEELRRNGGVPPPPQPNLPNEFVIQLYAPDQQVRVERKEGKWGSSDSYEFSMPITSFRTPSASTLDRGQSDPASLHITPKVNFIWKKESKLHKDLTCYYTGKNTDDVKKKSSRKDPDIIISLWRSLREMTIYEPNLSRVDIEDPRGLEMVLLLSAVVIKDVYFGGNINEMFNVSEIPSERKLSSGGRKLSNPQQTHSIYGAPNPLGTHPVQTGAPARSSNADKRSSLPRLQTTAPNAPASSTRPVPDAPPMPDPRAQWELDAETARLKAIAEAEAREERRKRAAMEKADEAAARRLQKQAEEEAKKERRRNAEIDRETERLRKLYGVQPIEQRAPNQANSSSSRGPYMQPIPQRTQVNLAPPQTHGPPPRLGSNGLYIQPAASSSALMMSGGNPNASSLNVPGQQKPGKKKSFFGLRSSSDDATERQKLAKKSSAMW